MIKAKTNQIDVKGLIASLKIAKGLFVFYFEEPVGVMLRKCPSYITTKETNHFQ